MSVFGFAHGFAPRMLIGMLAGTMLATALAQGVGLRGAEAAPRQAPAAASTGIAAG